LNEYTSLKAKHATASNSTLTITTMSGRTNHWTIKHQLKVYFPSLSTEEKTRKVGCGQCQLVDNLAGWPQALDSAQSVVHTAHSHDGETNHHNQYTL